MTYNRKKEKYNNKAFENKTKKKQRTKYVGLFLAKIVLVT